MTEQKKEAAQNGHATNNVQVDNNTCKNNKSNSDDVVRVILHDGVKDLMDFMQDPQGFINRVDKDKLYKFIQDNRSFLDTDLYNALTVFCGHELKKMPVTWNNKHLNAVQVGPFVKGLTKGQREKINRFLEVIYSGGKVANWRTTTSQFYDFCLWLFENKNYEDKNHKLENITVEFNFKISEYFKNRKNIDFSQLSKDQVYRYRATFKEDAGLIENTTLEIAEKKTDKHTLRLLNKVTIKGDRCKVIFDDELAQYIVDHKKIIHLHPALDLLTNSDTDQGAYNIGRFINERTENYGTNKKYLHTVKIEEIIKRLGIKYDNDQGWSRCIKLPFQNYMAALEEINFLTTWHYVDPFTGKKMDSKDIKNYADFIKMSIYFEVDFREIERKKSQKKLSKNE